MLVRPPSIHLPSQSPVASTRTARPISRPASLKRPTSPSQCVPLCLTFGSTGMHDTAGSNISDLSEPAEKTSRSEEAAHPRHPHYDRPQGGNRLPDRHSLRLRCWASSHTRHANDPSPVVVSAPCPIGRHEHPPPGSRPTAQQRRRAATPQPSGSRAAAPPHGIHLSARPLRRAATPPSSISTAQHRRRHTTSPRAAPTPPRASVAAH